MRDWEASWGRFHLVSYFLTNLLKNLAFRGNEAFWTEHESWNTAMLWWLRVPHIQYYRRPGAQLWQPEGLWEEQVWTAVVPGEVPWPRNTRSGFVCHMLSLFCHLSDFPPWTRTLLMHWWWNCSKSLMSSSLFLELNEIKIHLQITFSIHLPRPPKTFKVRTLK